MVASCREGTTELERTTVCARDSARFVIRCFLRDLHVVRMALAEAGAADAHEPRLRPQLLDRGDATVPHPGPESANQLENRCGKRTLERHAALDPLRDQFRQLVRVVLEVALAAALCVRHRRER